jgi:hypothetical protein
VEDKSLCAEIDARFPCGLELGSFRVAGRGGGVQGLEMLAEMSDRRDWRENSIGINSLLREVAAHEAWRMGGGEGRGEGGTAGHRKRDPGQQAELTVATVPGGPTSPVSRGSHPLSPCRLVQHAASCLSVRWPAVKVGVAARICCWTRGSCSLSTSVCNQRALASACGKFIAARSTSRSRQSRRTRTRTKFRRLRGDVFTRLRLGDGGPQRCIAVTKKTPGAGADDHHGAHASKCHRRSSRGMGWRSPAALESGAALWFAMNWGRSTSEEFEDRQGTQGERGRVQYEGFHYRRVQSEGDTGRRRACTIRGVYLRTCTMRGFFLRRRRSHYKNGRHLIDPERERFYELDPTF